MQFLGDNARFGAGTVELTGERSVGAAVEESDAFPFGVRGLLPVVTARRKKGGFKTVYAFPLPEGELGEDGEGDGGAGLARELRAAADFVNVLLAEAAELSGHPFGAVGAVWGGVPERGYCFTRVEELPSDDPGATPIHLRLETSDVPGEPDTLSAVLQYDARGYLCHALLTEFGEGGRACRVTASLDFGSGDVVVQRVVESAPGEEPVELYFRRHAFRERDGWRDRR